jgi:hypothetical protein
VLSKVCNICKFPGVSVGQIAQWGINEGFAVVFCLSVICKICNFPGVSVGQIAQLEHCCSFFVIDYL